MKRTAKIFVASALLFAVGAFAQNLEKITPIGFKCEAGNKNSSTDCSIAQYENLADFIKDGYASTNIYTSWYDLAADLETRVANSSTFNKLNLTFETDVDLGGYLESEKRCYGNEQGVGFYPINYHVDFTTVVIDGKSHTIKNYCEISQNGIYPSFFRKIKTDVTIRDLTFDNAYVMSKLTGTSAARPFAAVVVDEVLANGKASFVNVSVTNSNVYGWSTAAVVGNAIGETNFSKVTVDNVTLSSKAEVFDGHTGFPDDFISAGQKIYSGSLVASANAYVAMKNIEVRDLVITDAAAQIISAKGEEYTGYYYVGGLIGSLNVPLKADQSVSLKSCVVSAELNGVNVGGLIGNVSLTSVEGYPDFLVDDADVTLSIGTYNGWSSHGRNLGGLVGNIDWDGKVGLSGNKVKFSMANSNADASSVSGIMSIGGLVGYAWVSEFTDSQTGDVYKANVTVTDNDVDAEISTSEKSVVYVGGALGRVYINGGTGYEGSLSVSKSKIKADISATSTSMSSIATSYVVGYVYNKDGNVEVLANHAEGNIDVAATSLTSPGYVGSVMGYVQAASVAVLNNSSEGNLIVSRDEALANNISIGYEVGRASVDKDVTIKDNFHYGTKDVVASLAVGLLQIGNKDVSAQDWKSGKTNVRDVSYNYRNAVKNGSETLAAEGELSLDGSGIIIAGGDKLYDGVIDGDVMKSRQLTYVMNAMQPSTNSVVWENEPSNLPVISSQERTAYLLMVQLDAVYDELTTADKESLDGYLDNLNKRIYAYTEKDGHLSQDFVKKMKALSVNYGLVRNGNVVDLDAAMTYDIDAEAILSRTINVVYEMQDPTNSANVAYIPLEDYYSSVVYVWPKVESVQLWNASGLVPPVEGFNTGKTDYMAFSSAYVCMDGEQNCKDKQREPFSHSAMDFESVVASMRYYLNVSGSSTIHLVYAAYNPGLPTVVITNENKDYPVFVNGVVYYGKNPFARDNRLLAGASSSKESMKSSYKVRVDPGFKLNGWKVDLSLNDESNLVKSYELGADEALVLDDVLNDVAEQRQKIIAQSQNIIPVMEFYAKVNPDVSPISYTLSFDADANGRSVFVTDDWLVAKSYSRESAETAKLPELYGVDACFGGWALASDGERTTWGKTIDSDNMINLPLKEGVVNNLVAYWNAVGKNECLTPKNVSMHLTVQNKQGKTDDFGKVSLWQGFKGDTSANAAKLSHEFENDEMLIPVTDKSMTFHVSSAPKEGYALARMEVETTTSNANKLETAVQEVQFLADDTVFSITPASNVSYAINAVFGSYIDVALNQDRDDVFYGANSSTKTVRVVEGGQTILPAWIYTADECVLGWNKKSGDGTYVYGTVKSDDLMDVLKNDKDLYAVWGNSDECVAAGYNRLTLDAEHGSVQIAEIDGAGSEAMHSFAEDNTMLLPHVMTGAGWRVRGAPERGFKLDSLVLDFETKGPNNELIKEHFSLVEGDMLPQFIQGEVAAKAYFSEDASNNGSILLERHEFAQSGNAVRLNLKTNDFGANQSAMLLVTLKDAQGVVLEIDTLAKKINDTPYEHVWTKYPLLPGKYVLEATLDDGLNADSFDTAFTVRAEIAAAPNTWQMVSLSDVDEGEIVWDDDPVFYSWDESAEYGYAWKYQTYNGGEDNPLQGYWYNSLEGRSLVLRRDSTRSGSEMVWELDSGWNMVANPYGWNILMDQDTLEISKWYADRAGYDSVSVLGPYESVWLYSDVAKTVKLSADPYFKDVSGALPKAALAKAATRDSWTLQAVLSDAKGHRDSWNVLGVGEAKERLEPPAGMGDYVNLSVVEGKKALLKSIKSADDGDYEWNLALSATTDRVGYLKFEGVKALNEMGLRVFVTIDGNTTELGAGDSLRVMLKAAGSTATVRVSASEVRTVASKLENLRFARLPGALQVGFDVSGDLAGASYRVQLVGVNGKIAATYRGKSTAGHNTLALTAPKPGLYLLRVTLGGHSAVRKVAISR